MSEQPVERRDVARQFYIDHPDLTLRDVSEQLDISFNTIRDWSSSERWSSLRNIELLKAKLPDDVLEQASAIRLVLFSKILDPELCSAGDLAALVKSWMSTLSISKQEEAEETLDREELEALIRGVASDETLS